MVGEDIDWGEQNWGFFKRGPPESVRSSGYKNVAYALGELVDNSVEEDATDIDIIMFEKKVTVGGNQRRWYVQQIGTLDNGNGMDPFILRCALRYQDGSAQRGRKRGASGNAMGKFGVGLPQASISQCRKLEVWSWTDGGHENAWYCYTDMDEPDTYDNIPQPIKKPIPKKWLSSSEIWDNSGTLIVWSNLDRLDWKTSAAIHRNSELEIGRMYRKQISSGQVCVKMMAFEDSPPYKMRETDRNRDKVIDPDELHIWDIRAIDPLGLDPNAFYGDPGPPEEPPFDAYGPPIEMKFEVRDRNTGEESEETVKLTFSIAKQSTREGYGFNKETDLSPKGGSQPMGKLARRNMGLSIVRENRELELDDKWSQGKNVAYERWWGAELVFSKGMDDIFDVSNNKQHAQKLNDVAGRNWSDWRVDDTETDSMVKKRIKEEDYATFVCMTIKDRIWKHLEMIRKQLQKTSIVKKASRANKRHKSVQDKAKSGIASRRAQGKIGKSDADSGMGVEERRRKIREKLEKDGLDEDVINSLEGDIIDLGYQMVFSEKSMDNPAFFSVEYHAGSLIVFINEEHTAHKQLFTILDTLDTDVEEMTRTQLQAKARRSTTAVKMLLAAWARMEDEAQDSELSALKRIRWEWGTTAQSFLPKNEDEFEED